MSDILRVNIDSYNTDTSGATTPVLLSASFSEDILDENAGEYQVTLEKAEFPISNMDLFLNNKKDLYISFEESGLVQTFYIKGSYKTIQDLIDAVNKIMTSEYSVTPIGPGTPSTDYGSFTYDPETELITYEGDLTDPNHPITTHGIKVYFSRRLKFFLDFIPELYGNPWPVDTGPYPLRLEDYKEMIYTQRRSSVSRIYQMKSIRIFSPSLNQRSYFVMDYDKKTLVKTTLLTEIVINSAMFNADNVNVLYIPSVFRYSDIESSGLSIRNLMIYAMVHYSTGEDVNLMSSGGDYVSLTLCFSKKD